MPELPEVETTVRGLEKVLLGRKLVRVEPRRAKYGLIETDRRDTLIFHLGMSGRWRIDPDEIGKHDHLLLETDDGRRLSLNDPRRFGSLDLMPTANVPDWPPFRALGPEPLGGTLTGSWLRDRFTGRSAAVKLLLLDQRIVAGLGNIYVCEALFRARIDPRKAGGRVGIDKLRVLAATIPSVLEEAIAAGGSSLRDFARPDGELGYFSKQFDVYDREGEPCRGGCAGTVKRIVQGGRSTFYCTCQR